MKTKNLVVLAGLTLVASGLAISSAHAQSPRTIYLYNASLGTAPASVMGAKTGPWGNGEIKPTRQMVQYEGADVLEVTTRNFAEGARFDFKTPVNIDSYTEKGFIRLRLKFADDASVATGGGPGMDEGGLQGEGGGGRFPGGGLRGGGLPGGRRGGFRDQSGARLTPQTRVNAQFGNQGALPQFGGQGRFPGGGNFQGQDNFPGRESMDGGFPDQMGGPPPQKTEISELRVTLERENGVMMGRIPIDLTKVTPDDGGWRLFVLPLKDMKQTPGASGAAQRVILTSDNEDTFFMAQAALVIETGKMEVSVRPPDAAEGAQMAEITVKPGPITLIADVEAGAADPQVEWNFDADSVGNFAPPTPTGGLQDGGEEGGFPRRGSLQGQGGPGQGGRGRFPGQGGGEFAGGVAGDGAVEITGPRVDARGLTATFTYPNEEQNYRVEVKVTDKSGKKEPVTTSILVKVRG